MCITLAIWSKHYDSRIFYKPFRLLNTYHVLTNIRKKKLIIKLNLLVKNKRHLRTNRVLLTYMCMCKQCWCIYSLNKYELFFVHRMAVFSLEKSRETLNKYMLRYRSQWTKFGILHELIASSKFVPKLIHGKIRVDTL